VGFLKKKQHPARVEPTKLYRMSDDDVYLLSETSLMSAQEYLSKFRTSQGTERLAALAWMESHVQTAELCCQELAGRQE
jgi:hypothetical protein